MSSGVIHGPYSRREARRVAKSLDEPNEVIVLVDGVEDHVRTRWMRRSSVWRTPIGLAFQFLIISVYFGQGPGVMATLIVSPNAYANIPRAADLPQSSDEATVLQRKFREDWKTVAKVTYWIAGVIGVVFFRGERRHGSTGISPGRIAMDSRLHRIGWSVGVGFRRDIAGRSEWHRHVKRLCRNESLHKVGMQPSSDSFSAVASL